MEYIEGLRGDCTSCIWEQIRLNVHINIINFTWDLTGIDLWEIIEQEIKIPILDEIVALKIGITLLDTID